MCEFTKRNRNLSLLIKSEHMDDFTARMLERARNRAIRCNLTTGGDLTPSVAPAKPAADSIKPPAGSTKPLTGPELNTDRDRSPVRATGGAPSGDEEVAVVWAENKENSGPQKSSDTLHAGTRSHLKDLSSLYRIVDGTDSPSCAAGMSPPSSAFQQHRRGHQMVDSAASSRPTDDSQESAGGGGRAARSLRTRLASLGSRYHQQDERDLSARQQEIQQQEERSAAAAAARSPTRCRRWQVRSPSPLRRQVGPGERPAAAAEDDQQVSGGATTLVRTDGPPAVRSAYRDVGPCRTTVCTELKVLGIGEPSPPPVHRASLHLLPRAGLTGSSSPAPSPTKSSTAADAVDDEAQEHQQRAKKKLKQSDSGEDVRRPAANSPTKRSETAWISPSKLDQDTLRSLDARGLASADSRSRQPYGFVRGSPPPRVVASVTKPHPDARRSPSPTKVTAAAPYRSVSPMRCAFRDQVSPERQASPTRHLSPTRQLSPTRHLSPTRQPSPTRHLSPERKASPTRHLSPTRQPSPTRHLSPERQVSPTRRQPSPVRGRLIQERAALFDNAALAQPQLDPTELSLADRRKLFEHGQPPKVVARFGTAVTPDMLRQQAEAAAAAATPAAVVSKKRSAPEPPSSAAAVREGVRGESCQGSTSFQASRSVWETVHSKQQSSSSSVADPGLAQRQQRQHEINQLANKWRKPAPPAPVSSAGSSQPLQEGPAKVLPPPPPPPPPPSPPAQHQSAGTANSGGRYAVRVKPGCLYPCLSELDSEQSEDSSLSPVTGEYVASDAAVSRLSGVSDAESMGTRIQSLARQHQHGEHHGQHHYEQPSSLETINELTDCSAVDEDEYSQMSSLAACAAIDEVLEDMDGAQSDLQTPPKRAKTALPVDPDQSGDVDCRVSSPPGPVGGGPCPVEALLSRSSCIVPSDELGAEATVVEISTPDEFQLTENTSVPTLVDDFETSYREESCSRSEGEVEIVYCSLSSSDCEETSEKLEESHADCCIEPQVADDDRTTSSRDNSDIRGDAKSAGNTEACCSEASTSADGVEDAGPGATSSVRRLASRSVSQLIDRFHSLTSLARSGSGDDSVGRPAVPTRLSFSSPRSPVTHGPHLVDEIAGLEVVGVSLDSRVRSSGSKVYDDKRTSSVVACNKVECSLLSPSFSESAVFSPSHVTSDGLQTPQSSSTPSASASPCYGRLSQRPKSPSPRQTSAASVAVIPPRSPDQSSSATSPPIQDSPGVFRTPLVSVKSPDKDHHLPAVVIDKDAEMPLMHSVSFYRRQKPQEVVVTPVRRIVRNPDVPKYTAPAVPGSEAAAAGHQLSADQRAQEAASVHERIRCLHKEVEQQQAVMTQAGRALQLCDERVEFAGSQEMVEAERLLLVATHRRQAALCEVQRLRTEGVMHQRGIGGRSAAATRRGAISISSVSLPLKSSFVRQVAAGDAEHVYHFICLLRYRGVVIATQLLSSSDSIKGGAINFPNLVKFSELEADFSVVLEVYGLPTRPELMSHDAKYRIRKESRSKTPKKLLKHQSQTSASPGGSGSASARVSGFQLLGFVHLTGRSVSAAGGGGSCGGWNLERVPFSCPLEGQLLARVSVQAACSVAGDDEADEEQLVGFVTVFDDVNGLGAWHRRWCRLAGDRLCFWQYPEHDEQRRDPCQVMSLRGCITERVGAVARDVCARQNTLLLVMVRPSRPEDPEDSLVLQRHGRQTRIRNLLSFDTKEERVHWCDRINDSLSCLRAWEPESTQPVTNN